MHWTAQLTIQYQTIESNIHSTYTISNYRIQYSGCIAMSLLDSADGHWVPSHQLSHVNVWPAGQDESSAVAWGRPLACLKPYHRQCPNRPLARACCQLSRCRCSSCCQDTHTCPGNKSRPASHTHRDTSYISQRPMSPLLLWLALGSCSQPANSPVSGLHHPPTHSPQPMHTQIVLIYES